jgi:hypothetical protein
MKADRNTATSLVIGTITGLLSGLMGVGGGVIMVPLMVHFLPLSQHLAHGTSLAVVIFTGLASAITYGWQGSIDLVVALELAAGTVVGARIGALWMNRIPAAQLRRAFGVLLLLVGLRMVVPLPAGPALVSTDSLVGALTTLALGLCIGILSGLMGVGGGVFLVPAMVLLLGISQQDAQGISLAVVVPTAMVGAYTCLKRGNVATTYVPWLAVPSIVTAVIGAVIAHSLPAAVLRQLFGLLLFSVGGQMALTRPKTVPASSAVKPA